MDEVDSVLVDTIFKIHPVDMMRPLVDLVNCHDGKDVTLILTKNPLGGGRKLKLVSPYPLKAQQMMVVV